MWAIYFTSSIFFQLPNDVNFRNSKRSIRMPSIGQWLCLTADWRYYSDGRIQRTNAEEHIIYLLIEDNEISGISASDDNSPDNIGFANVVSEGLGDTKITLRLESALSKHSVISVSPMICAYDISISSFTGAVINRTHFRNGSFLHRAWSLTEMRAICLFFKLLLIRKVLYRRHTKSERTWRYHYIKLWIINWILTQL